MLLAIMDGLWAFTVGGLALAALMVWLERAYGWSSFLGMDPEKCANHGGNGNAGPFAYTGWEYMLPMLGFAWVLAIAVEQTVPCAVARRGGSGHHHGGRAAFAFVTSIVLVGWLPLGLAMTCS